MIQKVKIVYDIVYAGNTVKHSMYKSFECHEKEYGNGQWARKTFNEWAKAATMVGERYLIKNLMWERVKPPQKKTPRHKGTWVEI